MEELDSIIPINTQVILWISNEGMTIWIRIRDMETLGTERLVMNMLTPEEMAGMGITIVGQLSAVIAMIEEETSEITITVAMVRLTIEIHL